jgi:hypothetical protein
MTEEDEAHSPPPLHLLKMAVGISDLDDLRRVRAARIAQLGGSFVFTRNRPHRAEAVLRGGSLYWVIRGQIRARQRIVGFHSRRDEKGRAYCLIGVGPEVVATVWRAWRPFQGWRYLSSVDAPPDEQAGGGGRGDTAGIGLPVWLEAELRSLGLL